MIIFTMEKPVFNRFYPKGIMCCELIMKMKQYINLLEVESSRLSNLQLESNQLLDKFYTSKSEFEFLVDEMLQIKYFSEDKDLETSEKEKIEFPEFVKNVWQMGKRKLLENQQKIFYLSVVGCPLAEVTSIIKGCVEEVLMRLTYMAYHTGCISSLHSLCSQITKELQEGYLNTADACLRQCVYLKVVLPLLQELNNLIYQYIIQPDIFTPKQFVDKVVFQIPCIDNLLKEDSKGMAPFSILVDLLNGKLLDHDFLDQHSDIRPVVDDDSNLKKIRIVTEAVNWIVQKANIKQGVSSYLPSQNVIEGKRGYTNISPLSQSMLLGSCWSPGQPQMTKLDPLDIIKLDWSGFASPLPYQRKFTRRGRKRTANNFNVYETNNSSDLQPINLHSLQSPLISPLI